MTLLKNDQPKSTEIRKKWLLKLTKNCCLSVASSTDNRLWGKKIIQKHKFDLSLNISQFTLLEGELTG